jgi:hypothetical protein
MLIVPLPRRFYGGLIEAFRTEKVEWTGSEDLSVQYDRKAHDYVYYLRASAISAVTTWAAVSAASHITPEGGQLWADVVVWRAPCRGGWRAQLPAILTMLCCVAW